jgi:hypothetical protein
MDIVWSQPGTVVYSFRLRDVFPVGQLAFQLVDPPLGVIVVHQRMVPPEGFRIPAFG